MTKDNKTPDNLLLDHAYDGIEEYDHPIPNWLALIFCGTMTFAIIYFFIFQIGPGQSIQEEYAKARSAYDNQMYEQQAKEANEAPNEKTLQALLTDSTRRSHGKTVFDKNCASCHGSEGAGGIGANLTDVFWIHGGGILEILMTIRNGVNDKGMPPWKGALSKEDILDVSSFVYSLHGTSKSGGKAAEGKEVKR